MDALISWYRRHHPRRCFYCGLKVTFSSGERTLDHVVPRSKGGPNGSRNKVASCRPCNQAKKDLSVEEFRAQRFSGKQIEFYGETMFRQRSSAL
jgi:5-methylcytosine-specific restriction endonuclease McrA